MARAHPERSTCIRSCQRATRLFRENYAPFMRARNKSIKLFGGQSTRRGGGPKGASARAGHPSRVARSSRTTPDCDSRARLDWRGATHTARGQKRPTADDTEGCRAPARLSLQNCSAGDRVDRTRAQFLNTSRRLVSQVTMLRYLPQKQENVLYLKDCSH